MECEVQETKVEIRVQHSLVNRSGGETWRYEAFKEGIPYPVGVAHITRRGIMMGRRHVIWLSLESNVGDFEVIEAIHGLILDHSDIIEAKSTSELHERAMNRFGYSYESLLDIFRYIKK